MKEIANLARIVTSRSLSTIPVLDLHGINTTKERQLVTALVSLPDITPNLVVKAVYGKVTPSNVRAMQKLQSRVKAKMLNQLYFLDHSDPRHLVSRRYQLECLDLLHKVSILFAEGEYALTEQLLKRCLKLAQEGEFTGYEVQCARMLSTLHAQMRNAREFERMDKVLLNAQRIQSLEDEAERLHASTVLALARTVSSRRAVLPRVPEYIEKLESLHRRAGTFNTYYYLYRMRLAYFELLGDHGEIIRFTSLAARQLRDGKLNERRFDKRYNHFMSVYAHLRSRQPVKGLKLAQEAVRDFHPSSSNWLYFQENHMLLALHAQDYDFAQKLLATIAKSPAYPKQRPAALERWDLYRAYADFVAPPARVGPGRRLQMGVALVIGQRITVRTCRLTLVLVKVGKRGLGRSLLYLKELGQQRGSGQGLVGLVKYRRLGFGAEQAKPVEPPLKRAHPVAVGELFQRRPIGRVGELGQHERKGPLVEGGVKGDGVRLLAKAGE
ncbi:MAG TPA: hypothetical protein VF629_02945 [Hymenobacter sp.]|uniref:hypothetical protein n=1 Tax=Hymenobacter sp. TaxID=1898978 RepID=UPI002EDBAE9B